MPIPAPWLYRSKEFEITCKTSRILPSRTSSPAFHPDFSSVQDTPLHPHSSPSSNCAMNSFRFARAALRASPSTFRVPLQRRGYADAVADKLKLSLSIYKSTDVVQVNIPAESGVMGVLANHVPSIEQLNPGLVEIIEESGGTKQFFLSGGFAVVQPDSQLSINAVEAYPLEDFSAERKEN
ncbi:ATP synthase subunit delta [Histoplasma capsulatum H143]|uniref:ATP synthase subunit delta, mitochondrial n=1 Tax=Ajellomyces capsulatus (strain H143) TaxID=544712 RepID=C6HAD8_AJECH|nr:ATP synthase subunit delta [Histoplasma capsulatum H143]